MLPNHSHGLLAALALASLSGCVVYDDDCEDDFWADEDGDGRPDGYGDDSGWDDSGAASASFWMTPDTAEQGQTLIAGLQTDAQLDWATVTDIEIYGDVVLCTSQARPGELLLTLAVDAEAATGPVDMVLLTDEGETFYLPDVLYVVEAGADDGSAEGSSGGDSSGGDSSGGDSSGGDSSGGDSSSGDSSGACG